MLQQSEFFEIVLPGSKKPEFFMLTTFWGQIFPNIEANSKYGLCLFLVLIKISKQSLKVSDFSYKESDVHQFWKKYVGMYNL